MLYCPGSPAEEPGNGQLGKSASRREKKILMRFLACVATATILSASSTSFAGILAGPVVNPTNGHTYYLLTENTWTASQAEAVTLGGDLATINDQDENSWVFETFSNFGGTNRALWIGLTDSQSEGTFAWVSGDPSGFRMWSGIQPDNGSPGTQAENYVHMLWPSHETPGSWNDFQNLSTVNAFPLNGVVEIPEPGAVTLLCALGVLLLRRHQRAVSQQPTMR